MITLDVAGAYGTKLHGRTTCDGDQDGASFRTRILTPAILEAAARSRTLVVDFDGVASCTGGFCEAAFGDLVADPAVALGILSMTLCLRGTTKVAAPIVENAMRCMAGAWRRREDGEAREKATAEAEAAAAARHEPKTSGRKGAKAKPAPRDGHAGAEGAVAA